MGPVLVRTLADMMAKIINKEAFVQLLVSQLRINSIPTLLRRGLGLLSFHFLSYHHG